MFCYRSALCKTDIRSKTEVKTNYEWVTSLSNDDVTYLKELPYTISKMKGHPLCEWPSLDLINALIRV